MTGEYVRQVATALKSIRWLRSDHDGPRHGLDAVLQPGLSTLSTYLDAEKCWMQPIAQSPTVECLTESKGAVTFHK